MTDTLPATLREIVVLAFAGIAQAEYSPLPETSSEIVPLLVTAPRKADVRFNTHDFDFTNKPTASCSNKCDIRSVGTHEAGQVFGLKDIHGAHDNLTMYGNSILCSTRARTLGKGDVLGLRGIH
ncbi:hypothetical protein ACFY1L_41010 [Streptomyces sp. NPDC001663]|uniref:hypothetical protein n=1 Tax=Streptomyces sp. NPDC001663 TaxID=3364597 RepID=UPI003696E91C